ncbi:MAG: AMP-binding protein [Myxococcota bacterium]
MIAGRQPSELPGTALWPDAYGCLGDLLADALVQFKSEIALIEATRKRESRRLTYLDAWKATWGPGSWLQDHDLGADHRLAILMTNQPTWLIGACSAFLRGMTLVPLDYKLSGPEQASLLAHAKPQVLLVEYGLWRRLPEVQAEHVWVTEAPEDADLKGAIRFESLTAKAPFERVPRVRDDIACIVYSSGTGGTPKGCQLTHRNYLAQWDSLARLYPMQPGDRFFSLLPTNHAIDFMTGFIGPFACGGTVVHQRTLRPEFLRWTLQEYGITHIALVPRLLVALREGIEAKLDDQPGWRKRAVDLLTRANAAATWRRPHHRLSSRLLKPIHDGFGGKLKLIFSGGAFVPPDLAQFFYDLGLPVVIGYGLTEACTVATVNDLRPFRPDSVGLPVHGVRVRIDAPAADGVGEVHLHGPTVFAGYLDAPELTAAAFTHDGWLKTGDLGWVDGAGHLHLVGRSRNMVVTDGGKNVYPEDVEAAFTQVPCEELAITAANFVWPKRSLTGERLIAVVRHEDGLPTATLDALRRHNLRLPEHKRVWGVLPWSQEFPLTASLKLKRNRLAEQLRASATETDVVPLGHGS